MHRGARYSSPQVATRLAESISLEPARPCARGRSAPSGGPRTLQRSGRRATGNCGPGTVKSSLESAFDKLRIESRCHCGAVSPSEVVETPSVAGAISWWRLS